MYKSEFSSKAEEDIAEEIRSAYDLLEGLEKKFYEELKTLIDTLESQPKWENFSLTTP